MTEKDIASNFELGENDPVAHIFGQNDSNSLAETTQTVIREPIVLFTISTASLYNTENDTHSQKGQNAVHFN